jgi:predicted metal-dependent phosphoesterase TrpH
MFCDLHMHSTASDGSDPPEALPALAAEAGLSAMALTDHDTTAGLAECEAAADEQGIAFAAGIELSADPASVDQPSKRGRTAGGGESAAGTLHILGYFIQPEDPGLARLQKRLAEARHQRNPAMIARLQDLGVDLTHEEVTELAEAEQSQAPGRPHIARLLMQKGCVKSMHEAFARYIGSQGAAYVRKDRLSAAEAINAIHQAGGLASLAHPVQLELSGPELEHAVARLADLGLDAIEAHHSDHQPADVKHFQRLAERFRLAITGGSDYHGNRKRVALGSQHVPMAVYEQLRQTWERVTAR